MRHRTRANGASGRRRTAARRSRLLVHVLCSRRGITVEVVLHVAVRVHLVGVRVVVVPSCLYLHVYDRPDLTPPLYGDLRANALESMTQGRHLRRVQATIRRTDAWADIRLGMGYHSSESIWCTHHPPRLFVYAGGGEGAMQRTAMRSRLRRSAMNRDARAGGLGVEERHEDTQYLGSFTTASCARSMGARAHDVRHRRRAVPPCAPPAARVASAP